jgi:Leucine-rich repeat (LRR) protein
LPDTIAQLQHLEELDLGRNGLHVIPRGVASLKQFRKLGLDYNTIHEIPAFIGDLKSLRELSIRSNGGVKLPQSLAELKGLKLFLGNNSLKVADQKRLRSLYPQAVFDFRNEYDDASANERFAK